MPNTRDTVATLLNQSSALRTLGLPEDNVFQADTVESPDTFPFIVIRWEDEQTGMGRVTVRPFTLWFYDELGDYTRANEIGRAACAMLEEQEQVQTDEGWIMSFTPSLRGGDLVDEGFDALVVPYRLAAVASGI